MQASMHAHTRKRGQGELVLVSDSGWHEAAAEVMYACPWTCARTEEYTRVWYESESVHCTASTCRRAARAKATCKLTGTLLGRGQRDEKRRVHPDTVLVALVHIPSCAQARMHARNMHNRIFACLRARVCVCVRAHACRVHVCVSPCLVTVLRQGLQGHFTATAAHLKGCQR